MNVLEKDRSTHLNGDEVRKTTIFQGTKVKSSRNRPRSGLVMSSGENWSCGQGGQFSREWNSGHWSADRPARYTDNEILWTLI
ncbi:hypothetical protein RRG08_013354 [Elysia crispata]|uniref:Uncharacterized protein n=1 Tax=Elysia crispata TaxID=231223 RepID=A0AAE1E6C8_9GAST|nr:hypothetical protein RRG08_013354 [Elysia crispata]